MICRGEKKSNQSGFTLIEVLISVLILSMVVASASTAFVFATKTTRDNEVKMQAINLANEQIEYIRSLAFAEVGKEGGDPEGEIPAADDFKILNGRKYRIHTNINWSAGIDYKIVKVTVTPDGMDRLTQTIETCVAKQAAESVNEGANIIVRFTRGWKDSDKDVPIPDVPVRLETGPDAVRYVPSSSEGTSIFSNLKPGNYTGTVIVPDGMMLSPRQSENWKIENLQNLQQTVLNYEMEKPCRVQLTLMGLDDNPISVPDDVAINIYFKDIDGKDMPAVPFKGRDLDNGRLPIINHFWPVEKYLIDSIEIKGLNYYGEKKPENPDDKSDNPDEVILAFDGPDTCKSITCYFGKGFEPPKTSTTQWVYPNSTGIVHDQKLVANSENGTFVTDNMNLSLTINATSGSGNGNDFTAKKIFFLNVGTLSEPGLIINNNVNLKLHASYVDFRGWVKINDAYPRGFITLTTQSVDSSITPIKGKNGGEYGVLHVEKYMKIGSGNTFLGNGYYYFKNGTKLPGSEKTLIRMTPNNAVDLE